MKTTFAFGAAAASGGLLCLSTDAQAQAANTYHPETCATCADPSAAMTALQDAADYWNGISTYNSQGNVITISETSGHAIQFRDDIEITNGGDCQVPVGGGTMVCRTAVLNMSYPLQLTAFNHEFGHSIGLGHVGDSDSLMYDGEVTTAYLSDDDWAWLYQTYNWWRPWDYY